MEVMLDIETMGTGNRAAIIAIGAVAFDDSGVTSEFYQEVNLQSSIDAGMQIDGGTVMWWMQQSDEARSAFKNNESAGSLQSALQAFTGWFNDINGSEVWGNGAAFDNAILSEAYLLCRVDQPWKFWNDMCYRTVKNMAPAIEINRVGTYHNALDDAKSQALHLLDIRATL